MPRTADWFNNLSKKAQAEYIKKHPNSKYAKGAKAAKAPAKAAAKAPAKKVDADVKLKVKLKQQLSATREKIKDFKARGIKGPRLINLIHKRDDLKNKLSAITSGSKAASHEKKRAADKNKAISKTPSAKRVASRGGKLVAMPKSKGGNIKTLTKIKGKTDKETNLKQTIAGLRLSLMGFATTSPGYKARKARYDKARAELKALRAKK